MKISFIATVFNEESSIRSFLNSLIKQTKLPDEVVIVDGGSTDNTFSVISDFRFQISNKNVKIILKKGNRSVGRNTAIKHATGNVIVCSDAGCVFDERWIENIIKPFSDKKIDVVAGYYDSIAKTVFQKCLIPYVLVMSDKVDPKIFLPATRSMAFTKSIWENIGGFDEKFSFNEDYIFAKKLKKIGAKIAFVKGAVVYWLPRKNLQETFVMFYRFAKGDAQAKILRPKVLFLILRYLVGLVLVLFYLSARSNYVLLAICTLLFLYLLWAVWKNYKYVKDVKAFFWLPILQITSDIAVLAGTMIGFL